MSSVNQVDGDSEMPSIGLCSLGRWRTQQKKNSACQYFCSRESCPSSLHPDSIQFSSSLYVPAAFQFVVLLLEFWGSICEQVNLCSGPIRRCLGLKQPSMSPGWNLHWFSQPEVIGTSLSSIGTLGWGAQYGSQMSCFLVGTFTIKISFLIFNCHTWV